MITKRKILAPVEIECDDVTCGPCENLRQAQAECPKVTSWCRVFGGFEFGLLKPDGKKISRCNACFQAEIPRVENS